MSELAALATSVAKGVAKDVLYFTSWLCGDLAIVGARAISANLDTALRT